MALKVGVTGGIGAGKSVVCKIFAVLGVPIYDADARAKLLMVEDPELIDKIKLNFGKDSYDSKGKLNRDYIARSVFNDKEKVNQLNSIVHPVVGKDYMLWAQQHDKSDYIINEAALMIESGSYKKLDKLITVSAPVKLRVQRVLDRDPQRDEVQIKEIIDKQLSESDRQKAADYVIINDDVRMILPQVLELHSTFIDLKKL